MNQLKSFTTLFVLCILCLCVWLHTFSLCKTYFFVIVQLGVFQMNMGKLNEVMCFFLKKNLLLYLVITYEVRTFALAFRDERLSEKFFEKIP